MDIRHIPGRVNPADTLTRQIWVDDHEHAELVRASDRTMAQNIRLPSTATDGEIQRRLNELYSDRNEEERRQKAQGQISGLQFCEEEHAVLSIGGSRVQLNRTFRDALWRQVSTDEEYADIA